MKIIECYKDGCPSLNFVDENNVFVGFDNYQSCCEEFGWVITENADEVADYYSLISEKDSSSYCLEDYIFNQKYIKEGRDSVTFDLIDKHKIKCNLYLTLYNYHGCYYKHGFEFVNADGRIIADGRI